jgi:hypothetical protein
MGPKQHGDSANVHLRKGLIWLNCKNAPSWRSRCKGEGREEDDVNTGIAGTPERERNTYLTSFLQHKTLAKERDATERIH